MLNSAEHKIILPINVIMATIGVILTFIGMINTTSERLKARNFFICWYFSFYEQLKVCVRGKFYYLKACITPCYAEIIFKSQLKYEL